MKTSTFSVAKEGVPFILLSAFTSLICSILQYNYAGLGFLLATIFSTYFFRDPERIVPEDKNAVVSPADGKVIRVEEVFDDRFLQQNVLRVSIFMNVFDVHVNRIPFAGTVQRISFKPGRFYAADKDKAMLQNEYNAAIIRTDSGQEYAVVQIAGLIARRIICWTEPGDQLKTGERFGLIRFGSRVDLYLPKNVDLTVKIGEKVRAGETVLGKLTN
jgi:phosphatidylserine decarboxylase